MRYRGWVRYRIPVQYLPLIALLEQDIVLHYILYYINSVGDDKLLCSKIDSEQSLSLLCFKHIFSI